MTTHPPPASEAPSTWRRAVRLLETWREGEQRIDWLLESLPGDLPANERARVHALLVGTVRHLGRIEGHLDALTTRPPRAVVGAALRVAGFELLEGGGEGHVAKVGHHLVEQVKSMATAREAGFANAVVRKLADRLGADREPEAGDSVAAWARYHSHPEWLAQRWRVRFSEDVARRLMAWNQRPAPVLVRWRDPQAAPPPPPPWLRPVAGADGFFAADSGHWPELAALIEAGTATVQDPATRFAVELLDPRPGETVLDLCAAPGGKSLAIADRLGGGTVVALDLSGPRLPRLMQTLRRVPAGVNAWVVAGDVTRGAARALAARELPTTYSAVLLDVPCSNTGVMRHRVDVKWRLEPDSFRRHATQQLQMLRAAAERVAPGGRLVYSTCSIDPEENEQVIAAFLDRAQGAFAAGPSRLSTPWKDGHDGGGAFLLRRVR